MFYDLPVETYAEQKEYRRFQTFENNLLSLIIKIVSIESLKSTSISNPIIFIFIILLIL